MVYNVTMVLTNIPRSTQKLFWSCDPNSLDTQKNKEYIVHQVLQFGDLSDFFWLKKIYSEDDIRQIFIDKPRSTYNPQTFNFVKNFLLRISEPLSTKKYVGSSL